MDVFQCILYMLTVDLMQLGMWSSACDYVCRQGSYQCEGSFAITSDVLTLNGLLTDH